jgi:hypothetical protein
MTLRIRLHDDEGGVPMSFERTKVRTPQPAYQRKPAFLDWDDTRSPAMLLYLPDEPEIGKRFLYGGVEWEIVDYRDGWIARLVV